MDTNQELLMERFLQRIPDPSTVRLVRVSPEFPPELNPFAPDGIVIRAAGVPGEAQHSKWIIARAAIGTGIALEHINRDTRIIEATSGNTGEAMAKICNALDLDFTAVMSSDVPHDKIDAIRTIGRRTKVHLLSDADETTVAYARRLGAQDGWYNPCQYDRAWNWQAHRQHLAPQLWSRAGRMSLLFVPGGTMGTSMGLAAYACTDASLKPTVIPVLCAEGEEIPGARTLASVKKDVRQPWSLFFKEEALQFGSRHESFLLSFLTWPFVMPHLGPSFGLGIAGAFRFLRRHKSAGTLDQFKDREDGKIQVVVFGPDDCRPYLSLYLGELKKKELSVVSPPSDLLSVLDT